MNGTLNIADFVSDVAGDEKGIDLEDRPSDAFFTDALNTITDIASRASRTVSSVLTRRAGVRTAETDGSSAPGDFEDTKRAPPDPVEQLADEVRSRFERSGGDARQELFLRAGGAYWSAVTSSPSWKDIQASSLGIRPDEPGTSQVSDYLVVPRPALGRVDLLILRGDVDAVRSQTVDMDEHQLLAGIEAAQMHGVETDMEGLLFRDIRTSVILAPKPAMEPLGLSLAALAMASGAEKSTLGIFATNEDGVSGWTAALHGVPDEALIKCGESAARLVSKDAVSDSVFLELTPPVPATAGGNLRVMSEMLPRGQQKAAFTGLVSGEGQTVITANDMGLPHFLPTSQRKIYTGRDAQPGDSGSALVTDDGYVVGFAFERTPHGQSPEFCSWIWAASVMAAHKLRFGP